MSHIRLSRTIAWVGVGSLAIMILGALMVLAAIALLVPRGEVAAVTFTSGMFTISGGFLIATAWSPIYDRRWSGSRTLCPYCDDDLHATSGRDAGCPECGWKRGRL